MSQVSTIVDTLNNFCPSVGYSRRSFLPEGDPVGRASGLAQANIGAEQVRPGGLSDGQTRWESRERLGLEESRPS